MLLRRILPFYSLFSLLVLIFSLLAGCGARLQMFSDDASSESDMLDSRDVAQEASAFDLQAIDLEVLVGQIDDEFSAQTHTYSIDVNYFVKQVPINITVGQNARVDFFTDDALVDQFVSEREVVSEYTFHVQLPDVRDGEVTVGAQFIITDIVSGEEMQYTVDIHRLAAPTFVDLQAIKAAQSFDYDGERIVFGEPHFDSGKGKVSIYSQDGRGDWVHDADIQAPTPRNQDYFGYSVAIKDNMLVVGASQHNANSVGVYAADDDGLDAVMRSSNTDNHGAVFVYRLVNDVWEFSYFIKPDVSHANYFFGHDVAIHTQGNGLSSIAVSAIGYKFYVNNQGLTRNWEPFVAGKVFVYSSIMDASSHVIVQDQVLSHSSVSAGDAFGYDIAMSENYLVVGAPFYGGRDDSEDGTDESPESSGAVFIFARESADTSFGGAVRKEQPHASDGDRFGISVAVDQDTVIVGDTQDDSNKRGVRTEVDPDGFVLVDSGAVYVYNTENNGESWSVGAFIKAPNSDNFDNFGVSVSLHNNLLAIGSANEAGDASSVLGVYNNAMSRAGAVFVFEKSSSTDRWSAVAYLKQDPPVSSRHMGVAPLKILNGDILVTSGIGYVSW